MAARRFLATAPPEAKKGIFRRIWDYGMNIVDDYQTVARETLQDMKDRPLKSSIYVSLLTGTVVLFKTNPGEKQFLSRLTENSTELMLVGPYCRNPNTQNILTRFAKLSSENRLKCYNLGVCSIMCEKNYGTELGLYEAKCKYIKPHWTELYKTIVDVGVLGRWRTLENAMVDYDINPEEWLEDGHPNQEFQFYKDKSLVSWDMKIK